MLFQDSTVINGYQRLSNMTNDVLSMLAIEAIEKELLDCEDITNINVVCTESHDKSENNCFSVWDIDVNNYLFSVTNKGLIYND